MENNLLTLEENLQELKNRRDALLSEKYNTEEKIETESEALNQEKQKEINYCIAILDGLKDVVINSRIVGRRIAFSVIFGVAMAIVNVVNFSIPLIILSLLLATLGPIILEYLENKARESIFSEIRYNLIILDVKTGKLTANDLKDELVRSEIEKLVVEKMDDVSVQYLQDVTELIKPKRTSLFSLDLSINNLDNEIARLKQEITEVKKRINANLFPSSNEHDINIKKTLNI